MTALRMSSPEEPGWRRRRAGTGFSYVDPDGAVAGPEERERIAALVIPPAWEDVWICADPEGHLQAVGTDAAGRRQYLYHPQWREERDQEKFARMEVFGRSLGRARTRVQRHLALRGMPVERASATAFRVLDLGCLRIGTDAYAEDNGSFGLTTLRRDHVRMRAGVLHCEFVGKSGVEHHITFDDPELLRALTTMRRRRDDGETLLAHRDRDRSWRALTPGEVNDYVRSVTGVEATAKDFRTWHATVVAATALARVARTGDGGVSAAWQAASELLGNSPTQARTSYVDPRVVTAYEDGRVIPLSADLRKRECAVLRLLEATPQD